MNKLLDNSVIKWSAEDFDDRLIIARHSDWINEEAFNKLNALAPWEKWDIVDNAIEGVEDRIVELLNQEIFEFIISLSEKYNQ